MSIVKAILGFLVGIVTLGFLLFLASVRTPMPVDGVNSTNIAVESQNEEESSESGEATEGDSTTDEATDQEEGDSPQADDAGGTTTNENNQDDSGELTQPSEVRTGDLVVPQTVTPEGGEQGSEGNTQNAGVSPSLFGITQDTGEQSGDTTTQANTDDVTTTAPKQVEQAATEQDTTAPETTQIASTEPKATAPQEQTAIKKPIVRIGTDIGKAPSTIGTKVTSGLPTVGGENSGNRLYFQGTLNKTETPLGDESAFKKNAQQLLEINGPIFSIVIIDMGQQGLTRTDLLKADFPATFALSATESSSRAAASDFSAAGFETVILAPSDEEMSLTKAGLSEEALQDRVDKFMDAVPTAVGMIDNLGAELQKNRLVQKVVLDVFENTGHAILSYKKGLDPTAREAAKRSLPAGSVFRVLDGNNEDSAAIMRHLDRAVQFANQEGSVIVVGQSSPDTFAAIQGWIQGGKASGVTLGPVSAAIRAQQ